MNELKVFTNQEFGSIRTIDINNEFWFVGKDIATVLGYAKSENAIANHVDEEDKTSTLIQGSGSNYKSKAIIINESGLYSLILSSKLPKAKEFKRWVTNEVLPSIRKHGMYAKEELLDNPDFAIQVFQALKEERDKRLRLEKENLEQKQQLIKFQPVIDYVKNILNSTGLVTVSQIAKDYGLSGKNFNNLLHSFQVQYKLNNQWLLYSAYQDKGYTQSRTTIKIIDGISKSYMDTLWTQKGRLFLYNFLKDRGIVPNIEKVGRQS